MQSNLRRKIKVVAGAFWRRHEKTLAFEIAFFQRKKGDVGELQFEFPGGKLEANETCEQALQRELQEELLVEAQIGAFIGVSYFTTAKYEIELHLFVVDSFTPTNFTLTEHESVVWVSEQDKLPDLVPADKPLVEPLFSFLKSNFQV